MHSNIEVRRWEIRQLQHKKERKKFERQTNLSGYISLKILSDYIILKSAKTFFFPKECLRAAAMCSALYQMLKELERQRSPEAEECGA